MSIDNKNAFGGGNKRALYVPMSEIEMELISRLVDSKDIFVHVHGWGSIQEPRISFGDKNVHVAFKMVFDRPENLMAVHFFDMELKTRSGITLFRQKMNTEYGGEPLKVMRGLELDMVWDIAIKNIDPKLVKSLMPSARGLTSRLQDTTTGDITLMGNMKLDRDLRNKIHELDQAEKALPLREAKILKEARESKRNESKQENS
jgi:hypothetical protein